VEMVGVIETVIGCEGQWRAGKKNTQTPWVMGIKGLPAFCLEGQTSAQGQCTAKIRTLYRLFRLQAPLCSITCREPLGLELRAERPQGRTSGYMPKVPTLAG